MHAVCSVTFRLFTFCALIVPPLRLGGTQERLKGTPIFWSVAVAHNGPNFPGNDSNVMTVDGAPSITNTEFLSSL